MLVIAIGNPSRGDDALGPLLAERLAAQARADVEVLVDFQLQIEHALDLEGRERVIFVDASLEATAPYEWQIPAPDPAFVHTTHALSPGAVLATMGMAGTPVPAEIRVLAVRGERFELGEGLSAAALRHLEAAWGALQRACIGTYG